MSTVCQIQSYTDFPAISARIHHSAGLKELNLLDNNIKKEALQKDRQKYITYKHLVAQLKRHLPAFSASIKENLAVQNEEEVALQKIADPQLKLNTTQSLDCLLISMFSIVLHNYILPISREYSEQGISKHLESALPRIKIHIEHGFQNMLETTLGVVGLIPRLFEKAYKQKINIETYKHLARKSINLISDLAKLDLSIFFTTMRRLIVDTHAHPKTESKVNLNYEDKYFRLIKQGTCNPSIEHSDLNIAVSEELTKETIDKVGNTLKDHLVFGCPAYYVDASDDKNLITVVFDWIMDMLDKYYFPHWERVSKN